MIILQFYAKIKMPNGDIKYADFDRKMQNDFTYEDQENEKIKIKEMLWHEFEIKEEDIVFIKKEEYEKNIKENLNKMEKRIIDLNNVDLKQDREQFLALLTFEAYGEFTKEEANRVLHLLEEKGDFKNFTIWVITSSKQLHFQSMLKNEEVIYAGIGSKGSRSFASVLLSTGGDLFFGEDEKRSYIGERTRNRRSTSYIEPVFDKNAKYIISKKNVSWDDLQEKDNKSYELIIYVPQENNNK